MSLKKRLGSGYDVAMTKTYEVEIKSLLGSPDNAQALRERLANHGFEQIGQGSQLNHYFEYTPDDAAGLIELTQKFLTPMAQAEFADQLTNAKKVSIRTRQTDEAVYFVAKLSVGDDSSANGVLRHEIQEAVDMSMAELDQGLLDAGLEYQAKWSREREEYRTEDNDFYVTIDKNAGYGYLAEVELEVSDESELDEARQKIVELMRSLEIVELDQDRLGRMFEFYNQNWRDYYGTEEIFTIE